MVVQRNDTETFFFDALRQVEMYRSPDKRFARTGGAAARPTRFSRSRKPGPATQPPPGDGKATLSTQKLEALLAGQENVRLASLSWDDRSRMLKLLYAKINRVDSCQRGGDHYNPASGTLQLTVMASTAWSEWHAPVGTLCQRRRAVPRSRAYTLTVICDTAGLA